MSINRINKTQGINELIKHINNIFVYNRFTI